MDLTDKIRNALATATMEKWKCLKCSLFAWRYQMEKERHTLKLEFAHSIICHDIPDKSCPGRLVRTGKTRIGYMDEVLTPDEYDLLYPKPVKAKKGARRHACLPVL